MKNGWYILYYHNISWEENPYFSSLADVLPPDIFADHLKRLDGSCKFVSVPEGYQLYQNGQINECLCSIWFDDGLSGVRTYALPLLNDYHVTAAMSVNSSFFLRKELSWCLKLSLIRHTDALRLLRTRLRKHGYAARMSMREFIMNNLSAQILKEIDSVYNMITRDFSRQDAFRVYDSVEGIKALYESGWEIANHSASHYPLYTEQGIARFKKEFFECEAVLKKKLNINSNFWVVPFGGDDRHNAALLAFLKRQNYFNHPVVLTGDKINFNSHGDKNILFRINTSNLDGDGLLKKLRSL